MAGQYEPVILENIEQGKFLADLGSAIGEGQQKLIRHVGEHGSKTKCVVSVKLEFQYTTQPARFDIATEIDVKPPKQPSRIGHTNANLEGDPGGDGNVLWCLKGGTFAGNPRQQPLRDAAGEPLGK